MEYKLVVVGAGGVGEYDSIEFFVCFLNRLFFSFNKIVKKSF